MAPPSRAGFTPSAMEQTIKDALGVVVRDADGDGTIDEVYGGDVTVHTSTIGLPEVLEGVPPREQVGTKKQLVTQSIYADQAMTGAGGTDFSLPSATRFFDPQGTMLTARSLIGKKEGPLAKYLVSATNYLDRGAAAGAEAERALYAAADGGFVESVPPAIRTGARQQALAVMHQILNRTDSSQPTESEMDLYFSTSRTLALLKQDPDKPLMLGKTAVADNLSVADKRFQERLLDRGMTAQKVYEYAQFLAIQTHRPVALAERVREGAGVDEQIASPD